MGILFVSHEPADGIIAFNYFILLIVIFYLIKIRKGIRLLKTNQIEKYINYSKRETHKKECSVIDNNEDLVNKYLKYQNSRFLMLSIFPLLICVLLISYRFINNEKIFFRDTFYWHEFIYKNCLYIFISIFNSLLSILIFTINKLSIYKVMLTLKLNKPNVNCKKAE